MTFVLQRLKGLALVLLVGCTTICFAAAGDLDTTFNGTGKVTLSLSPNSGFIEDIALQPDGKIVAVGRLDTQSGMAASFFVARFNPNGSLDTGFGQAGITTNSFDYQIAAATAVALQKDGKIIVTGWAARFPGASGAPTIIARYLPNGALDAGFSDDGFIEEFSGEFSPFFNFSLPQSIAIQADGKIIVVGGFGGSIFVLRYTADGRRDRRFGYLGRATITMQGEGVTACSVGLHSNQNISVVGYFGDYPEESTGVAFRLRPHGKVDSSFNANGSQTISFGTAKHLVFDSDIQPDGKIVIVGHYFESESGPVGLAVSRLNVDGSFDNSFDDDGKLTIPFGQRQAFASDIEVQPDGKLIIGGNVREIQQPTTSNFLVVRRNSDGSPDLTFGQAGIVETSMSTTPDAIQALAIQPDGKIIAAGNAESGGFSALALARYIGH